MILRDDDKTDDDDSKEADSKQDDKDDDKDDSKQDDDDDSSEATEDAPIKKRSVSESNEVVTKSYPVDDLLLVCLRWKYDLFGVINNYIFS